MGTVQVINPNTGKPMNVQEGSKVHQNYLKNNPSAVVSSPSTQTTQKPSTSTPSYSQPSYSQPSYSQPSYSQPSQSSSNNYNSSNYQSSSPSYSTPNTSVLDFSSGNQRVDLYNPTTGKTTSNLVNQQTFDNYLKQGYTATQNGKQIGSAKYQYSPGQMASNTAKFSKDNLMGNSGVFVNGKELSHGQALGQNPLHVVNGNRQQLIMDAIKTGDWSQYNNFEAGQDPLRYDKGADGNYSQNKNYYAQLISSSYDGLAEAQRSGNKELVGVYERELQQLAQKYNNAPGMAVYIPRIHDSGHGQGNMYGIKDYDKGFMDSVYNQGSTGFVPHKDTVNNWLNTEYGQNEYLGQWLYDNFADGDGLGQSWATNNVFRQNPEMLDMAMQLSNTYGSAEEQAVRQGINQSAMEAYLSGQGYAPQVQAPTASPTSVPTFQPPQVPDVPFIPPTAPTAPSGNLDHIYTPGGSANSGGYVADQLVTNDTFMKYLESIYKGGF